MRNDICFVCLGQCAGNIGQLFERKGYSVLFLNTASIDIKLLAKSPHVWKIPGAEGCNQDPEKARGVFAQSYDEIMNKIIAFAQKRITYFICSSSGGTGGGMTPLVLEAFLEYLAQKEDEEWAEYDKLIDQGENAVAPSKRKAGLITALPSLSETAVFNANAFNFMKNIWEIYEAESSKEHSNLASYILIDNENCEDLLALNRKFVDCFDRVLKIPEQAANALGNVDKADLESAFTAPGILTMAMIDKNSYSTGELVRQLRRSDIFAQLEGNACDYWVSSTVDALDVSALETELGMPKAHFKTFNDAVNLFVVSGTGLPAERIELLADRAEERKSVKKVSGSEVFSRRVKIEEEPKVVDNSMTEPTLSVKDKLSKLRKRRL